MPRTASYLILFIFVTYISYSSHIVIAYAPKSGTELKDAVDECLETNKSLATPGGIVMTPFTHRGLTFKNRIGLAPLTRGRASRDGVVNNLHVKYYTQRASSGFLLSEATAISKRAHGWFRAPGIWTNEQVCCTAILGHYPNVYSLGLLTNVILCEEKPFYCKPKTTRYLVYQQQTTTLQHKFATRPTL